MATADVESTFLAHQERAHQSIRDRTFPVVLPVELRDWLAARLDREEEQVTLRGEGLPVTLEALVASTVEMLLWRYKECCDDEDSAL
jgi:hypothetical protein